MRASDANHRGQRGEGDSTTTGFEKEEFWCWLVVMMGGDEMEAAMIACAKCVVMISGAVVAGCFSFSI